MNGHDSRFYYKSGGKWHKIHHHRLIAGAIIHKGDNVLIGRKDRNKPHPSRGQWAFPAGMVEPKESPFDAVVREVKEETGLKVRSKNVIDFVSDYVTFPNWGMPCWYTFIYIDCPYNGGIAKASDDLVELKWVKAKDINKYLTSRRPPKGSRLEKFVRSLK